MRIRMVSLFPLFGLVLWTASVDLEGTHAFQLSTLSNPSSSSSTLTHRQLSVSLSAAALTGSSDDDNYGEDDIPFSFPRNNKQQRDVVIVGGALAGLSTALYLSQMDPSRHITILDREDYGASQKGTNKNKKNAQPASFAAAGMLAPQSERLPPGPLLDLCLSSRRMFPDFCDMVESLARDSGRDGAVYLHDNEFSDNSNKNNNNAASSSSLDPWSVGYVGSGGFLAPAFAGDAVATWAPPDDSNDDDDNVDSTKNGSKAVWLDAMQVRDLEPVLHPDVVGGWWFPDDASVDARRLTCSLRAACVAAGVQLLNGPQYEVSSLDLSEGLCRGLWLQTSSSGEKGDTATSGQRYIQAKTVLIANGAWMRQLLPVPIEPHKGQSLSLRMPKDRPPILRRVLFAQDTYIVPKADGRIIVGATVEAGSYDPNVTPLGLMHILTHALELVPGLKDLPVEESWVGLRPTTPDKGPILGETPWKNMFVAGGYWRNGVLLSAKTGHLLASLIVSQNDNKKKDKTKTTLSKKDFAILKAFAWDRFTTPGASAAVSATARYAASMHPIHTRSSAGVSAAVGTELGSHSSARAAREERQQDRQALTDGDDDMFEKAAAMGRQDISAFDFGKENGESPGDSSATSTSQLYMDGAADALTVGVALSDEDGNSGSDNDLSAVYASIQANKAKTEVELPESIEDRTDPGFRIHHVDSETGVKREVPPYTSPGAFAAMVEADNLSGAESIVDSSDMDNDLTATYEAIRKNKDRKGKVVINESVQDDRPDPGFRIHHVDPNSRELREVPPYTPPGTFLASLATNQTHGVPQENNNVHEPKKPNGAASKESAEEEEGYSEQTYDGYQDIQQANSRSSRKEELETMREARRKNRLGQEKIDENKIGAKKSADME